MKTFLERILQFFDFKSGLVKSLVDLPGDILVEIAVISHNHSAIQIIDDAIRMTVYLYFIPWQPQNFTVETISDDSFNVCLAVLRIFNHDFFRHGHILIGQLDNVTAVNHKS